MPVPLECPYQDGWKTDPSELVSEQLAGMLEHFEAKHSDQIPQPVRELLKACAKELRENVPV